MEFKNIVNELMLFEGVLPSAPVLVRLAPTANAGAVGTWKHDIDNTLYEATIVGTLVLVTAPNDDWRVITLSEFHECFKEAQA